MRIKIEQLSCCTASDYPRILPVKGDATYLEFPDNHFDVVLCAEVLEHIPSPGLEQACVEIARVARGAVIIGVPFRQDIRSGRTTCQVCHRPNPPCGHVNSFDENRLHELFSGLSWVRSSFVGMSSDRTNRLSALLLDYAGNPFGTYEQDECCVHCRQPIGLPQTRSLLKRIATRLTFTLNTVQIFFVKPHPNWIHVLFLKSTT
ncbi:MAG: class I SAM-dependent methyltransferase [Candidatus Competibacteraceae bacterium]|nr:class I SAM-dependent methyltransferase [Candidatus Competibacteraceae bacterium]